MNPDEGRQRKSTSCRLQRPAGPTWPTRGAHCLPPRPPPSHASRATGTSASRSPASPSGEVFSGRDGKAAGCSPQRFSRRHRTTLRCAEPAVDSWSSGVCPSCRGFQYTDCSHRAAVPLISEAQRIHRIVQPPVAHRVPQPQPLDEPARGPCVIGNFKSDHNLRHRHSALHAPRTPRHPNSATQDEVYVDVQAGLCESLRLPSSAGGTCNVSVQQQSSNRRGRLVSHDRSAVVTWLSCRSKPRASLDSSWICGTWRPPSLRMAPVYWQE